MSNYKPSWPFEDALQGRWTQARSVGSQDGFWSHQLFYFLPNLLLDLLVFDD